MSAKFLTLPRIAQEFGVSIDRLRRNTAKLSAAGLIHRVGASWMAESSAVPTILERVGVKAAAVATS